MNVAAYSGIELQPPTSLEVAYQPDEFKYYVGGRGGSTDLVFDQPDQSDRSRTKRQHWPRVVWVLAFIAVVSLAVAIGAGLGAGLAAQHKSSLSRGAPTEASNSPATVTQPGNVVTVSQTSITSASQTSITSTSPTPVTSASPICPAANGSTYTASNKPPSVPGPEPWQISNLTLSFEIFCSANIKQGNLLRDLQVIEGISSLSDCLDQCALYSFRTRDYNFPALGCLGVAWDESYDLCWLKSNVTLESLNGAILAQGIDGAVLLDV